MKKLMKHKLAFGLICGVIVLIVIGAIGLIYMNNLDKAYDSTKKDTINISIESGSTTADIGTLLEKEGIIGSESNFRYFSKFKGYDSQYQAGAYALSPSMTLSEIAEIIISGKTHSITFTIPEGYTIYQIAEKLADEGLVEKAKFIALLENGKYDLDVLMSGQTGKNQLEGYLFPDTYMVEAEIGEEGIINTMLSHFDELFTAEFKKQAKNMNRSINEIIVIASIIERECVVDEDRGKVSSVIYNRLKEGMPLQMDSTVQYVLGKQKETLSYNDTEISSPYNTYTNTGLPPGPIGAPGLASIKAALYPENTDLIYFVVSEKLDGSHVFSKDYNKFLKDKDAYYKALETEK